MNTKTIMGTVTALVAGIALSAPAHAQDMKIQVKTGTTAQKSGKSVRSVRNRRPMRYVTLSLRNVPVRTALMQLFQKSGRDYSLPNTIDGMVNMRITNKPFDEALRLIANNATQPFTYFVDSGVYFIKPRVAEAAPVQRTVVARRQPVQVDPNDTRYLPTDPAQFQAMQLPSSEPRYLGGRPPVTLWGFGDPNYAVDQGFGFPGYNNFPPVYYNFPTNYGMPYGATNGNYIVPGTTVVTPGTVVGNGGNIINMP